MNLEPKGRNDGHKFDFSKITDQIYLGSDLCKGGVCLIHGHEFKKLGVNVEINLSLEGNELPPKNIETYIWLPVVDGYAPSMSQLGIGTSAMNEAIKNEKVVYVHCTNGHGRSPSLIISYLIRYGGKTYEDAHTLVKEKRLEIHIEDIQRSAIEEFALKWLK